MKHNFLITTLLHSILLFILLSTNLAMAAACRSVFTVNKFYDTYDGDCSSRDCSLRDAIAQANNCAGHNEVRLPSGTYTIERREGNLNTETIDVTQGDFDLTNDITIKGDMFFATTIDATFRDRIFHVWSGTAKIQHVQMINGQQQSASRPSSAIYIRKGANAILTNVSLSNNGVLSSNGVWSGSAGLDSAIVVAGILHMEDSYLVNNSCVGAPDGRCRSGAITVMGGAYGILKRVYATLHRNGVISSGGDLTVEDSDFVGNASDNISPPDDRGAPTIIASGRSAQIYRSRFINNQNGAIAFAGWNNEIPAYLTIASSTFRGNSVPPEVEIEENSSKGGAIAVSGSNSFAAIYDSVFIANTIRGKFAGGGAIVNFGNVKIVRSIFENNMADHRGGAIDTWGNAEISDSSFISNYATYGGAFYGSANASIVNSTFDSNTSGVQFNDEGFQYSTGAALYINGPITKMKNITLINNEVIGDPIISSLAVGPAGDIEIAYSAIGNENGAPACAVVTGYTSYGYNVVSDWSCPFAVASGPLVLGPLTPIGYTAGAPGQQRVALHRIPQAGSPLHNTGEAFINNTDDPAQKGCTRRDARGVNRPVATFCDIGAVEATGKFFIGIPFDKLSMQ